MVGASSVGSGGVVFRADAGTFSMPWASVTSLDLALDPESFSNLDPDESGFVLSVVGVCRPCRTFDGGRSRNSMRSGILSKEMGLVRRNRFCTVKRDLISAKIVSILVE